MILNIIDALILKADIATKYEAWNCLKLLWTLVIDCLLKH